MNNSGALEVLLPAVQPQNCGEETGVGETFGTEMLKITDRHKHFFCFGPTHEEVITDIALRIKKL